MIKKKCPRCKGSGFIIEKKRNLAGERNGNATLDDEQVRMIRALGKDFSVSELARKFKCSGSAISDVLTYRTWAHVDVDYNDAPALD